ncbi:membrane-fusion protein [Photobacterium aphoticum]|uniref:Membrane-fusion protein n=1 Tax=Photobacterium aphoticum TaxID=754436 RepID=A0A090QU49_9GAMM|nr:membrane-fusion protein [Photobacterium aphoticum]
MLALDEAGNLGIKTIVDNDKVKFIPIAVVKVEPDGVWLGDTPNPVEVITVGQGFVRDGDTVIPAREQDKADSDNKDSQ